VPNSFCHNFIKNVPILIIFDRYIEKWLKFYAIEQFSTSPDSCNRTTLLNTDVLISYVTVMETAASRSLTALKSISLSRVSKWMEHAIATTFLPRSYCWTCAGYPRTSFLSFNRMAPLRIEHATLSLSWSERRPTSSLQHCGHRIHPILTQSTIAYGMWFRRFSAPDKPTSTNLKRDCRSRFDQSIVYVADIYWPVASSPMRLCPYV
jgi:hypothetical protein